MTEKRGHFVPFPGKSLDFLPFEISIGRKAISIKMETLGETGTREGIPTTLLPPKPLLFGVLNITSDSFSDGGKYLEPESALHKAISLIEEGADVIDIGAQSSNPAAKPVGPEVEWERIGDLIRALKEKNIPVSVDSYEPQVIRKSIRAGADYINHIKGFIDKPSMDLVGEYSQSDVKFIIMYSQDHGNKASRSSDLTPDTVIARILDFFQERERAFLSLGIARERIILDPGMGFFLSPDYKVSFQVIASIERLLQEFPNQMVSVTRKSFLGNGLGGLPVEEREIPTVVSELFLWLRGVPILRTHSPSSFLKGMRTWELAHGKF